MGEAQNRAGIVYETCRSGYFRPVLDAIPDEKYIEILRPLINSKRKTVKAKSEYEANMKLIKFALGRGFEMKIIRQCMDEPKTLTMINLWERLANTISPRACAICGCRLTLGEAPICAVCNLGLPRTRYAEILMKMKWRNCFGTNTD